jgi:predicted Zn-dependent protease
MRIAKSAETFLTETGQQDKIKNYKWEFNLIEEDKTVIAWVMPGGKAAVYTGILPFTQNETGLAVVLGHEVAHALADHGNERMSEALVANTGGMALSVALSQRPQQTQQLFMKDQGLEGSVVGVTAEGVEFEKVYGKGAILIQWSDIEMIRSSDGVPNTCRQFPTGRTTI